MSSSYYLKKLDEKKAYLTKHPEDQYILLDGVCHPDFYERPLSAAGGKLCVRKPGTQSFPETPNLRYSMASPRGSIGGSLRRKLWADHPNWETRTDHHGMGYDPREGPYSQVSVWQGELRRVPDQAELVDGGYLRQSITMDGIGFGSNGRRDRHDYLSNFNLPPDQKGNEPRMPRKYNVCDLTQKYPLWKEATKAPGSIDLVNGRRMV